MKRVDIQISFKISNTIFLKTYIPNQWHISNPFSAEINNINVLNTPYMAAKSIQNRTQPPKTEIAGTQN